MLWNASYFIAGLAITLSILIFVHELGHFVVAKRSGVRVERFSIGFGPRIAGFRRGETEYVISLVFFGGYVRMAGEDPEGSATGAQWEFMSKSKRTRALIVVSGPVMNFMLSVCILASLAGIIGVDTLPAPIIGSVPADSPAAEAGLKLGDRIFAIDGSSVGDWDELTRRLETGVGRNLEVIFERAGTVETTFVNLSSIRTPLDAGFTMFREPVIGDVAWRGPAYCAGIRDGDRILMVDGKPISTWDDMRSAILTHPGDTLELVFERDGAVHSVKVVPKNAGGIGMIEATARIERHPQGFLESLRLGFETAFWTAKQIRYIARFFVSLLASMRPSDEIGGPIRIGEVAGDALRWGISNFLWFIALISAQLSVINLIPVPILDGGHLLLLGIETISRRPVTTRQRAIANQVGFAFLVGFMILVTLHDILRIAGQ